jgi:acyl transferase domain-containing protein
VNTELQPWTKYADGARRAGVSAFGFGGTNFHVVLEEYAAEPRAAYRLQRVAQPVIIFADTPAELLAASEVTLGRLTGSEAAAAYGELTRRSRAEPISAQAARLGFVADSLEEAVQLLKTALPILKKQPEAKTWEHPRGIYYRQQGLETTGKIAALFPGQGSQYLNMGREIALNFPPLRQVYEQMDAHFLQAGMQPLSEVVFPVPAFEAATLAAQEEALRATDYAQAAIGVTSAGLFRILAQAGFRPDFTAGHSFGELSALWAAGVLDDQDFLTLVKARGQAMVPPADHSFDAGSMLAVQGELTDIEREVAALPEITIANQNSPKQVALAGPTAAIRSAHPLLESKGFKVTQLNVAAAFHTPLVSHASAPFAAAVKQVPFHPARLPVYSNTTGQPYPADAEAAKAVLANHILHPVIFKTQVEHLYAAGARVFVEVGPRRVITNLVADILAGQPHVAVALNSSREKPGDRQFRDAAVQLKVAGVPLSDIDPYQR